MKVNVFMIVYLTLVLCACNNDGAVDESNGVEATKIANERDSLMADEIFHNLCYIDTLTNGTIEYKLKEGKALDPTRPSEMSIGVDSASDARKYFLNKLPLGLDDDVVKIGNDLYFDLGNCGYYRLNFVGTSTVYYRLELHLNKLQTSIFMNLIPSEAWPYNVSSPYYKGNVLSDANEKIWLCVKSAVNGQAGILMSWDYPVPTKEVKYYYRVYRGRQTTLANMKVSLYCNASTEEEWNCLADMYYNYREDFNAMYKSFAKNSQCTETFRSIKTSAPAQLYHNIFSVKHLRNGQSYRDANHGAELGTGFITYYISLERNGSSASFKGGSLFAQSPSTDVIHNTISKSFNEKLDGFVVIYPAKSK